MTDTDPRLDITLVREAKAALEHLSVQIIPARADAASGHYMHALTALTILLRRMGDAQAAVEAGVTEQDMSAGDIRRLLEAEQGTLQPHPHAGESAVASGASSNLITICTDGGPALWYVGSDGDINQIDSDVTRLNGREAALARALIDWTRPRLDYVE